MLTVNLNEKEGIAILEPDGDLSEKDFQSAARIIDPFIEKSGKLNGIIIHVKSFPRWDSFSALITHLKFIYGFRPPIFNIGTFQNDPETLKTIFSMHQYGKAVDIIIDEDNDFSHIAGGCNVLYQDGHVEWIRYPGEHPAGYMNAIMGRLIG